HDDAGALVGNVFLREPAVSDGLLHGDVVPARAIAHEAHHALVYNVFWIELRLPGHLRAKTTLRVIGNPADTGLGFAQARQHFLRIVADRGDDAHSGDDDATHVMLLRLHLRGELFRAEQTDLQILGRIDGDAVRFGDAIGDNHMQLAADDA